MASLASALAFALVLSQASAVFDRASSRTFAKQEEATTKVFGGQRVEQRFVLEARPSLQQQRHEEPQHSPVVVLGALDEVKAKGVHIFRPYQYLKDVYQPLIQDPEAWTSNLGAVLSGLDLLTVPLQTGRSLEDRAVAAYCEILKSLVTGRVFGSQELSVECGSGGARPVHQFDQHKRDEGQDWAYFGTTMTGTARLDHLQLVLTQIVRTGIAGDIVETGVWRGGSSIMARGVVRALGEGSKRLSYVCDSFQGLPPGGELHPRDRGWSHMPYLEVASETVAANFMTAGVLDANIVFVKGFFNDTMPHLRKQVGALSLLRLDGDMYKSTVDVLYNLYDKVVVGGYVIIDDWNNFPAKDACLDFFAVHNHHPEVVLVPGQHMSTYWQKKEAVTVQRWRLEQGKFKP